VSDDLVAAGPGGGRLRRIYYESELNPEQLRVAMHPGGPMLALAGAGTGKTRTLVFRVCRLIEDGVPPGKILLLTFTNKAAKEMLERVSRLIEGPGGQVTGGTFHSTGHRILRRYAELLGYTTRFSILDREDATDLMGSAVADLEPELPQRRMPRPKLLVSLYSFVINTGRDLDDVLLEQAPQYLAQNESIVAIFKRYMERKRQADAMDFDDLLLNWLLLLRKHPEARRELIERFSHILVDEYQDTNRMQADIVESMLGPERNLMVVGDDAQSIYAFRGADFDNIIRFPERHPDCEIFRLETNYRSLPPILELANATIEHNQRQFRKVLEPIRKGGEKPWLVSVPTPEHQATFVADMVLELREEGYELDDMAVLYRAHSHSLDLQIELTRRNIPYQIRSGVRFFEQQHIKDVLSHLRFVANPRDEVAFIRMVKLRRHFGPRLSARLWERIRHGDPLQLLVHIDPQTVDLPDRAARVLPNLQEMIEDLAGPRLSGQPGEAIRHVIRTFYREYVRESFENAASRLDDLEQLALFADGYQGLTSFLSEITLLNDLSGEDAAATYPDECLTLSTAHQAKGLEWKAVFLIWLSEGRFPAIQAEDEEEERRLFYVSVTRARDRLFLVQPQMARDRYQVDVILDPSRFLLELPPRVTESVSISNKAKEEEPIAELPPGSLYTTPGFIDDGENDDDVN
jgi:DNA helicase-2/ATP-dependent DNA helicase PcrA